MRLTTAFRPYGEALRAKFLKLLRRFRAANLQNHIADKPFPTRKIRQVTMHRYGAQLLGFASCKHCNADEKETAGLPLGFFRAK